MRGVERGRMEGGGIKGRQKGGRRREEGRRKSEREEK